MPNKKFKCPYCGKSFDRNDLVCHIGDEHSELIPPGFTPLRIAFNSINYNDLDYSGKCVICGAPTAWDENKGRYDRLCDRKSCRDTYIKRFEDNMQRVNGVSRISKTVEGQEKMLSNRKISGKYKFRDGGIRTYTGSYELATLKFMDTVLDCKSKDVVTPGPVMKYEYEGEDHWYIPDIFYIPYNLLIEVKDGGDKPNNRNMPDYRAKQIAKEKYVIDETDFNYLRLTNKDFSQLLATMADLKLQLVENTKERIININENMFAGIQGMFPMKQNGVYITNRLMNNAFSGDSYEDYCVSDTPAFDSVFYRDADGILKKGDQESMEECTYDTYWANVPYSDIESKLYENLDEFVGEDFIYETVFCHEPITNDQIKFEPLAESVMDLYKYMHEETEMFVRYATAHPYDEKMSNVDRVNKLEEALNGSSIDESSDAFIESKTTKYLNARKGNPIQEYILNYIDQMGGVFNG